MDVGAKTIKDEVASRMGAPVDQTAGWQSEKEVDYEQYQRSTMKEREKNAHFDRLNDPKERLKEMYAWGRRVRRDILILEACLIKAGLCTEKDFHGDPGDPPPPPET